MDSKNENDYIDISDTTDISSIVSVLSSVHNDDTTPLYLFRSQLNSLLLHHSININKIKRLEKEVETEKKINYMTKETQIILKEQIKNMDQKLIDMEKEIKEEKESNQFYDNNTIEDRLNESIGIVEVKKERKKKEKKRKY
jgi:hypothetical protein